jgi:hypothetical protein
LLSSYLIVSGGVAVLLELASLRRCHSNCLRVAPNFGIYPLGFAHVSLAAGAIYEDALTTPDYVCCAPALSANASDI